MDATVMPGTTGGDAMDAAMMGGDSDPAGAMMGAVDEHMSPAEACRY
jgi:isoaspartyl peptidase/L-asparaginase-like protein (Ntn-hydrolase superfamily)